MRLTNYIIAMAIFLSLGACQTASVEPMTSTPSGRPEITVNKLPSIVRPALINRSINKGWSIVEDTDTRIVIEQRWDNFGANMMYGTDFNRAPNRRITYTLVKTDNGTRIIGESVAVSNPGSGFQQLTPLTSGTTALPAAVKSLQDGLDDFKANLK